MYERDDMEYRGRVESRVDTSYRHDCQLLQHRRRLE